MIDLITEELFTKVSSNFKSSDNVKYSFKS